MIILIFLVAGAGIFWQVWTGENVATRILALGTFSMCLDCARMAIVDLRDIETVRDKVNDPRLQKFYLITVSTIVIESIGFYTAVFSVGWGALIVLCGQILFQCLAGIKILSERNKIIPYGIKDRFPVLIADGIGVILTLLWIVNIYPTVAAIVLLSMVIVYTVIKYAPIKREERLT